MKTSLRTVTSCSTRRTLLAAAALSLCAGLATPAYAQIATVPTTDPAVLKAGLPATGLTVDHIVIRAGMPGQFGVYTKFSNQPVTIRDGLVLSSGDVTNIGPLAAVLDPNYDPASPPAEVNNQMTLDPDQSGGTLEFDTYGADSNHIENFNGSFDVAAIEVHFTLEEDSAVKFDFIFGSVEYPYWTSSFTDAFLVFLDGTNPVDQITFDANDSAVQVGSSFAGLTLTSDTNTAFASPHGLIHHLTTTTARLDAGNHVLIFEVGDVNDHILDSVAFITNLRAEAGTPGTEPSDDPCNLADITEIGGTAEEPGHADHQLTVDDIIVFVNLFSDGTGCPGTGPCSRADICGIGGPPAPSDGELTVDDVIAFFNSFADGC